MPAQDTTDRISALLHEAADAHHVVYRTTDGDDPIGRGTPPCCRGSPSCPSCWGRRRCGATSSTRWVELDRDVGAPEGWEGAYAAALLERFGAA